MEGGDILFHTPELSSPQQLLLDTDMHGGDDKLWCGLEYNYDLLALADLREIEGVFDSLAGYLQKKRPGGSYAGEYKDSSGNVIMDGTGSISLLRTLQQSGWPTRSPWTPPAWRGACLLWPGFTGNMGRRGSGSTSPTPA